MARTSNLRPESRMAELRAAESAGPFKNPMTSLHPSMRDAVVKSGTGRVHARASTRQFGCVGDQNAWRKWEFPKSTLRPTHIRTKFSVVMRQRAVIAMGLSGRTIGSGGKIEPTTALDVPFRRRCVVCAGVEPASAMSLHCHNHDRGLVAELVTGFMVIMPGA